MTDDIKLNVSPWHEGEVELQRRAGVAEQMDGIGRKVMRAFLLDQHREFYPLLPFIVVGAVDPEGAPWATIRAGQPGFLHSPDPLTLAIDAPRDANDPAERGIEDGDPIGLVGVDLITRRRNRLNGTVNRSGEGFFSVTVTQSFGNCPRYIQNRHFAFVRDPAVRVSSRPDISDRLTDNARRIIAKADTFFVASYADLSEGGRQVDVSHRGGRPGFVRIDSDGGLTVPDFNGNLFFNTLGNFMVNPRAGLLFVDDETGDMLQLTGRVELILESSEIGAFEGAERLWRVIPEKVVLRADALPLRWTFAEAGFSPATLMTGSWDETKRRLDAAAAEKRWRRFLVERVVVESETIHSLHLVPIDGEALIPHLAGQHLPVRIADGADRVRRSYTISSGPADGYYRLSVKREGRASSLLHRMQPGDEIEALAPAGGFTIDALDRRRPAVLLAAGIGITPMLSMLRHLVREGDRTRYRRPVWLFRSSRTLKERPFDRELEALVERGQGSLHDIRALSAPRLDDKGYYDAAGRIDIALLKRHLPFGDYDFYLCGPPPFMQSLYQGLRAQNVADERIHAEAFGPSALQRDRRETTIDVRLDNKAASVPTRVLFTKSAKESRWKPGDGSLLTFAEQRGLSPAYGCRAGNCGDCKVRVTKGKVSYFTEPSYPVAEGEALICISVPAEGADLCLDA